MSETTSNTTRQSSPKVLTRHDRFKEVRLPCSLGLANALEAPPPGLVRVLGWKAPSVKTTNGRHSSKDAAQPRRISEWLTAYYQIWPSASNPHFSTALANASQMDGVSWQWEEYTATYRPDTPRPKSHLQSQRRNGFVTESPQWLGLRQASHKPNKHKNTNQFCSAYTESPADVLTLHGTRVRSPIMLSNILLPPTEQNVYSLRRPQVCAPVYLVLQWTPTNAQ